MKTCDICSQPGSHKCSKCQAASYCSKSCQASDWPIHKRNCSAPQLATASQIQTMLRIGNKSTITQESIALGLNPDWIIGVTGADVFGKKFTAIQPNLKYWRQPSSSRETYDVQAEKSNKKARTFWLQYFSPISTGSEWIDPALDAILHARLPGREVPVPKFWENQVNANVLAALFPFLHSFTPRQNHVLLDIFGSKYWSTLGVDGFSLATGMDILLRYGKPSRNLLDKVVRRCLDRTRKHSELDLLLRYVVLPIQKFWPDVAGTKLLDLCFILISPGRGPKPGTGWTPPPHEIIMEIATVSPAAFMHMLAPILTLCMCGGIDDSSDRFLKASEEFGLSLSAEVASWLEGDLRKTSSKVALRKLVADDKAGLLPDNGFKATVPNYAFLIAESERMMTQLGGDPEV